LGRRIVRDRRRAQVPVEVDRRSGNERRGTTRRITPDPRFGSPGTY